MEYKLQGKVRVTHTKFRGVASLEGEHVLSGIGTQRAKTELSIPSSNLLFLHQSPPLELYLISLFLSHPHVIHQWGLSTVPPKHPNSAQFFVSPLLSSGVSLHQPLTGTAAIAPLPVSHDYTTILHNEAKWSLSQITSSKYSKGLPSHLEWNLISILVFRPPSNLFSAHLSALPSSHPLGFGQHGFLLLKTARLISS